MRIMIISDTTQTVESFARCMAEMGHVTEVFVELTAATAAAMAEPQDLVVLMDRAGFDAVSFIRHFREAGYEDPVLIISRDDAEASRIAAFDAGADQVCSDSAGCEEWQARVRTLLRHCKPQVADVLTYGELKIDLSRRVITRDGKVLQLKGKPFSLLEFFVRRPEVVHSRERIARSVWDQDFDLFSNVIEVTMSKVRSQVDRNFDPPYLHTVSGHGYTLDKNPRSE